MAKTSAKKKKKVNVEAVGQAHIQATFNNIIISLTNNQGQVISWSSAGKMGFRGSKKNTPYAAQVAAIRSIHNTGIEVMEIMDVTPLPHNGCRPPKRRRV